MQATRPTVPGIKRQIITTKFIYAADPIVQHIESEEKVTIAPDDNLRVLVAEFRRLAFRGDTVSSRKLLAKFQNRLGLQGWEIIFQSLLTIRKRRFALDLLKAVFAVKHPILAGVDIPLSLRNLLLDNIALSGNRAMWNELVDFLRLKGLFLDPSNDHAYFTLVVQAGDLKEARTLYPQIIKKKTQAEQEYNRKRAAYDEYVKSQLLTGSSSSSSNDAKAPKKMEEPRFNSRTESPILFHNLFLRILRNNYLYDELESCAARIPTPDARTLGTLIDAAVTLKRYDRAQELLDDYLKRQLPVNDYCFQRCLEAAALKRNWRLYVDRYAALIKGGYNVNGYVLASLCRNILDDGTLPPYLRSRAKNVLATVGTKPVGERQLPVAHRQHLQSLIDRLIGFLDTPPSLSFSALSQTRKTL